MELVVKEYLGNRIEFKMINGNVYANANQMASGFGGSKKLENWKNSPNTKRYIEALSRSLKNGERDLIIVNQGGKAKEQGTWIHEKLILNFARYLNVEFELWCDEQIATLLRNGKVELRPKQVEDINIEFAVVENIARIMGYNDNSKALMINKLIDHLGVGKAVKIEYTKSKGVLKPLSQLLKENDVHLSAIKVNKKLLEIGIIEEKTRSSTKGVKKYKAIKNLDFGENQVSPKNPKETQPLYYEEKFDKLMELIKC